MFFLHFPVKKQRADINRNRKSSTLLASLARDRNLKSIWLKKCFFFLNNPNPLECRLYKLLEVTQFYIFSI